MSRSRERGGARLRAAWFKVICGVGKFYMLFRSAYRKATRSDVMFEQMEARDYYAVLDLASFSDKGTLLDRVSSERGLVMVKHSAGSILCERTSSRG